MDSEPFIISTRVNGICFAKTLVDSGCLAYGTVSQRFARKWRLERIPITPRPLTELMSTTTNAISEVAYMDIDLDGHQQRRIFLYVIPNQKDYDIVLGHPWMISQDVTLAPGRSELKIGASDITLWSENRKIRASIPPERFPQVNCAPISAPSFGYLMRQSRDDSVEIFSASIADIDKMLRPKAPVDPREKLPTEYHEYLDVFSRTLAERLPPQRPGIDHKIVLEKTSDGKDPEVPWGPLYSMSRGELLVLRKTLTELLDKNFIRASCSPAAAPVLFAKKPGGGLRFCVDYRALNTLTQKDRYPLPLIKETLSSLSKAKWFTKLDIIAAFHKIRIAEGEEWKTAFRTRYGLFEWLVTPFGLTGAPATFQRYINWVLREYLDEFCSAYIDDILIFSDGSLTDHRNKVKKVLQRLREAGLQLDIGKCEFEVKTVRYLGFIIEAGIGVSMEPEKVKAIMEWEAPRSTRGVRAFVKFANYYYKFIHNFFILTTFLTELTKKDTLFK